MKNIFIILLILILTPIIAFAGDTSPDASGEVRTGTVKEYYPNGKIKGKGGSAKCFPHICRMSLFMV